MMRGRHLSGSMRSHSPSMRMPVPIAIGYPKGRPAAVAEYCKKFVEEVKAPGFVRKAIDRMGGRRKGLL